MNQRRGVFLTVAALATMFLAGAVPAADSPRLDATKRGDVAEVRSLLAEGADPNVAQGDGLTALHLAAQEGDLEIAELLIGAGAMVDAQTRIGGYTALHLASGGAHSSVVGALLEAGANAGAVTTTWMWLDRALTARSVQPRILQCRVIVVSTMSRWGEESVKAVSFISAVAASTG